MTDDRPARMPMELRVATWARVCLFAGAALFVLVCMLIIGLRLSYPFELEWMEGATVDHVRRVIDGRPLYGPPTLDFLPFIYMPGYYYVGALATAWLGGGFVPLRLVSIGSSVGSVLLIFSFVRRESGSAESAFLAAALFVATFGASGHWFDLARADNLALCLSLAAVWLLRFAPRPSGAAAAGLLLAVGVLTKQGTLAVVPPLAVAYAFAVPGARLAFAVAFAVPFTAAVLFFHLSTGGWFTYYVFSLPSQHPWTSEMWTRFWTGDVLRWLPVAAAFSLYALYAVGRQSLGRSVLLAAFLGGFVGSSWLARLHEGGYFNTLMPAHAALAVLFGIGQARLRAWLGTSSSTLAPRGVLSVYVACLIQFGMLVYNPFRQVPDANDLAAGHRLLTRIAGIEGDVYLPFHGYLPALAGKRSYAHEMAIRDIFKGHDERIEQQLADEIDKAFRQHRFAAVILDGPSVFESLDESYDEVGRIFEQERVFLPVTGRRTRPETIHLPHPRTDPPAHDEPVR